MKKKENSPKVNFTIAFCTFRNIASSYLGTPTVSILIFCYIWAVIRCDFMQKSGPNWQCQQEP